MTTREVEMIATLGTTYTYGAHIAVALALISLGIGFLVCIKAHKYDCCKKFGKFVGAIIIIISFLLLICLATLCAKSFIGNWQCSPDKAVELPEGHPPIK